MVNLGSIPEGEQKIVVYSYVGCSVVYIRAVLSCPVLLSPHEYGLVQFSSVSFPRLEFIRVRFSDEELIM